MHWVPKAGKIELLKEVFKCLKPGGIFLFNSMTYSNSCNWLQLLPLLSDKSVEKNLFNSVHCQSNAEWEGMVTESGFLKPFIECKDSVYPFDDIQQNIETAVSAFHCIDYDATLQDAMKIVNIKL